MHLLSLKDISIENLNKIINKSLFIKKNPKQFQTFLKFQTLAMLFQKTSTRTRVSFEVAMTQLGGHAIFLDWKNSNFTLAEIQDEIRYLSRNVELIMARCLKNSDLLNIAKYSKIPIINGCCNQFHPCQIISDFVTIKEKLGQLENLNILFVGIHNNICNSIILASDKLGLKLNLATPHFNKPSYDEKVMKILNENKKINTIKNINDYINQSDIIYTDSWIDMEYFNDPDFESEKKERLETMKNFQLNMNTIKNFKGFIMHDMPIHVNFEITREVIESKQSIIFDQSENRLHTQKAIMLYLLNKL